MLALALLHAVPPAIGGAGVERVKMARRYRKEPRNRRSSRAGGAGQQIARRSRSRSAPLNSGWSSRPREGWRSGGLNSLICRRDLGDAEPLLGEIVVVEQIDVRRHWQTD